METRTLPAHDPAALNEALRILAAGGVVAFPTDTVYGVGALVTDAAAIAGLYEVKARPPDKAIPVLLADSEQLPQVASEVNAIAQRLAARFWPGALTLIVLRRAGLPEILASNQTVGVRVPDHPAARALLAAAGPLAVTSANLSGGPDCRTAAEVEAQLGGRLALILDGGETPGGVPSTVVDTTGEELYILRAGPISDAELQAALDE